MLSRPFRPAGPSDKPGGPSLDRHRQSVLGCAVLGCELDKPDGPSLDRHPPGTPLLRPRLGPGNTMPPPLVTALAPPWALGTGNANTASAGYRLGHCLGPGSTNTASAGFSLGKCLGPGNADTACYLLGPPGTRFWGLCMPSYARNNLQLLGVQTPVSWLLMFFLLSYFVELPSALWYFHTFYNLTSRILSNAF